METRVFAPATISNLGPGFDVLGLALVAPGDTITARLNLGGPPGVSIVAIRGDDGALPVDTRTNTAGVAAMATLKRISLEDSVEIEIDKGMPIGSGLGSSAASAAAAAFAVNVLLGSPLSTRELVGPCIEAETAVSGRHGDNVAPALMGGLIMVRSVDPIDVVRVPVPAGVFVACTTPAFEVSTRRARTALPQQVSLQAMVRNGGNLAGLVSACHSGNLDLLGTCMTDDIVGPARAALIPGSTEAMRAASDVGAIGTSISGGGPTILALCGSADDADRAGAAMAAAFQAAGLPSSTHVSPADCPGARTI